MTAEEVKSLIKNPGKGMVIDGILASEALDKSAEIIEVKGCDISSLEKDGYLNVEHKNAADEDGNWDRIIGKCIKAKKIYSAKDCANNRELHYWNEVGLPFIYGQFRLFDGSGHPAAIAAAAIIRDGVHNGEPPMIKFSIEGTTLLREDNVIKRAVARCVASTIRPCNATAISGVLFDPNGPPLPGQAEKQIEDELAADAKKAEQAISGSAVIGSYQGQYNPIISDPEENPIDSLKKAVEVFRSLNKMISAGMPSGAPGTLTGGEALQREDVSPTIRNRLKAALRDYDKYTHKSFKEFLKHRLPDVSEKFLDRFADLADDATIRQKVLTKAEQVVSFRGNQVKPGEIEVLSGPHKGKKFNTLHADDKHLYVSEPSGGQPKKVALDDKSKKYKVTRPFEVIQSSSHLTPEHVVYGDAENAALANGVDVSKISKNSGKHAGTTPKSGWTTNAQKEPVYVKSAEHPLMHEIQGDASFTPAHREAAYHSLAKEVFGLGEHVPPAITVRHPESGEFYSIHKGVQGSEHHSLKDANHSNSLLRLGNQGTLDKLAIMDMILHHGDRHSGNYLLTPGSHPDLHLIDNGFAFSDRKEPSMVPSYLTRFTGLAHGDASGYLDQPLHPAAAEWVKQLDAKKLKNTMAALGVPPKMMAESYRRLVTLKDRLNRGNVNRNVALFTPFLKNVKKNEVTPLVQFLQQTYPDIENPVALELEAQRAFPGVDLLIDAQKARNYEVAHPDAARGNHRDFLWYWWRRTSHHKVS